MAAQLGPPDDLAAPEPADIVMFDGEVVDRDDPDALIDAYEKVRQIELAVDNLKSELRKAIAAKTTGEAKTRYVVGRRRKAKVEMPSDQWEQSKLREAWHSYPQFRDDYLRIGKVDPKLVEVRKLERSNGDAAFNVFRDMVLGANRGPLGLPTVSIVDK